MAAIGSITGQVGDEVTVTCDSGLTKVTTCAKVADNTYAFSSVDCSVVPTSEPTWATWESDVPSLQTDSIFWDAGNKLGSDVHLAWMMVSCMALAML